MSLQLPAAAPEAVKEEEPVADNKPVEQGNEQKEQGGDKEGVLPDLKANQL